MPTLNSSVELRKWDAVFRLGSVANVTVNSYDLPAKAGMEQGGKEVEFVLDKKPAINVVTVPIEVTNLRLLYQPALTEEFEEADCEIWTATHVKTKSGLECLRPENVVGSYAAYHDSKRDNEYKTGKAFHIYRPQLIDAEGKKAWAEFNRDAETTRKLIIMLPQKFLDEAVYPVTIDPTFGYTSIGASNDTWGLGYANSVKAILSEAGTITSLSLYCSGTINVITGLYADSGGAAGSLLATSSPATPTSTPAWVDFPINYAASAATYHLVCLPNQTGTIAVKYDSASTHHGYKSGNTYPTLPNPFNEGGSDSTNFYSFYATYTTGATVQTVTDSLSLSDSTLRHKALLLISDSAALAEAFSRGKAFAIIDSLNLADVERALKELRVHDASSLADAASTVSRILQVSESVSVAEVVQVGGGGVRKTRLFLILGDLALQLT